MILLAWTSGMVIGIFIGRRVERSVWTKNKHSIIDENGNHIWEVIDKCCRGGDCDAKQSKL